jgi:hypothetical protein
LQSFLESSKVQVLARAGHEPTSRK